MSHYNNARLERNVGGVPGAEAALERRWQRGQTLPCVLFHLCTFLYFPAAPQPLPAAGSTGRLQSLLLLRKSFPPGLERSSCPPQESTPRGLMPAAAGDAPEPGFVFQSLILQNILSLWALRLAGRGGFAPAG